MNLICKAFGHKWDKKNPYEQNCIRKRCTSWRAAYIKKHPKFGEPASGWKVFDFESLNFKNL